MLRRLALAALLALSPSLALAQVNSPDFSIAAYVKYVLSGNVVIGGNLTVGGILFDTGGIAVNSPTGGNKGPGTINVAADYYKNGTIIPETVSLPLALSAGGNVSCPTCVLISGTAHGDSAYAILSTDRYVYANAAFTAPRAWTLPAANSLAAGTTIWVQDAQGTVTTTNTLTVQRAGADTVNVTGTNIVMTGAGGGTQFTTDGVSNWGTAVQTVTTGGTGRQTLTNHGVLVGAATNPLTQLAVGANGSLLLGATGADPAFGAMSQDCTITAAGVITCLKTNNVAFGALATVTPGTGVATAAAVNVGTAGAIVVNGGALGTPSSGTLTSATGLPLGTGVTGTLLAAQEPAHTGDVTNTAGSLAMTLAAGNAGNLNSGTLLAARMPALTGDCTSTVNTVATTCTKINGVDQTTAWTVYTPTIVAQTPGGTPPTFTLTTNGSRSKTLGKTVFLEVDFTVTAAGTGVGYIKVSLPATSSAHNYTGSCYDYANTASQGTASITTGVSQTDFIIWKATGGTFIVTGSALVCGLTYELP